MGESNETMKHFKTKCLKLENVIYMREIESLNSAQNAMFLIQTVHFLPLSSLYIFFYTFSETLNMDALVI